MASESFAESLQKFTATRDDWKKKDAEEVSRNGQMLERKHIWTNLLIALSLFMKNKYRPRLTLSLG